MRTELFMYCCIKNYIGTQGEDFTTIKVLSPLESLCYRPLLVGGHSVILTLCSFVFFTTGCFMLSFALLFVLMFF